MSPGIQMLEVAIGIKDSLVSAGFTLESLVHASPADIATVLGIEMYVAKLILDAAKRAAGQNYASVEDENALLVSD
jgi:hypothetical protein